MKDSFQMLSIGFSSQVAPPFSRASAFPGTPEDKMITASMQTRVCKLYSLSSWARTIDVPKRWSESRPVEAYARHLKPHEATNSACWSQAFPATENEIRKWPIEMPALAMPLHSWHVIVVQVNDNSAVSLSIRRLRHHSLSLFEMIKVPFHISLFRSLCEDRLRFLFCCFILCTIYQTKNHVDYYAVAKEGGPKCSPNRK